MLDRLRNGETLCHYPVRLRCGDDSVKHVLVSANARIEQGELRYARCQMQDITERQEREDALNARLLALAEFDRRKDEFLARLGHELRNPLTPIISSLELMQLCDADAGKMMRYRDIICRQASLLMRLVDDLLDMSRLTRGKIALQRGPAFLEQIIDQALEITRPLLEERRHRLTLAMPKTPIRLHADSKRLTQMMASLLHNACKYTANDGQISLQAQVAADQLELVVSDNGIGIDPASQEEIFDLFVQGAGPMSKACGGLGVGLTLARRLARMHGGDIGVCSKGPGQGSRFIVRLPLPDDAPDLPASSSALIAEIAERGEAQHILIVDDNVDAAESLAEFLKACGHRTSVAHDGPSAISQALQTQPDVIILDIGMPSMNGYQVAQRLRREVGLHSSLLVALSGYTRERDRICSRSAGFDHHLDKPLDMDKLTAVLQQRRQPRNGNRASPEI